jgi:hypothetical protein
MKDDAGIDRSRTRAHGDPVHGRKTHRSIDAACATNRRERTSAAEMTKDLTSLAVTLSLDDLERLSAGVAIAGPMKAVADEAFSDPLIGPGVGKGCFRQRAVESGIEDRELRDFEILAAAVLVMALTVVAINRALWKRLQRLGDYYCRFGG